MLIKSSRRVAAMRPEKERCACWIRAWLPVFRILVVVGVVVVGLSEFMIVRAQEPFAPERAGGFGNRRFNPASDGRLLDADSRRDGSGGGVNSVRALPEKSPDVVAPIAGKKESGSSVAKTPDSQSGTGDDKLLKRRTEPIADPARSNQTEPADSDPATSRNVDKTNEDRFQWKPALVQSGLFLAIQHGFRLTQVKTRRELGGPFFSDWARSVKGLRGWRDGDNGFTNYVAHPLQGGLTGRIFVNNSPRAKRQEFNQSRDYWRSRLKALIWSTVWDVQFELGPVSEASFGNVGKNRKNRYSTMGYVDLVVTPTVGTGVLIGEDAIDKYILKGWLEKNNGGKATFKIKLLRSILTPTTAFSNILRGKTPWTRDFRPN